MDIPWDDLRLFLVVAEAGSLSAAARTLQLGQPTLSRRIAALEEAVGEPLFTRRAQGCTPTSAGLRLLPAAQRMAEWAHEAGVQLGPKRKRPQVAGCVRVAAPPGVAALLVARLAAPLRARHPQLRLEVRAGVETLNLARGEADLSLRTRRPRDPDLVVLASAASAVRAYAASGYAERLPLRPQLARLDWIAWAEPWAHLQANTALARAIPGFAPAFASDDFLVQLAACQAGAGVFALPRALAAHPLLADLRELPLDLGPEAVAELHLVTHKRHQHQPKVQAMAQMLQEALRSLDEAAQRQSGP